MKRDVADLKRCSQCRTLKSATEFSSHPQSSDGLHPWCKACRRDKKRISPLDRLCLEVAESNGPARTYEEIATELGVTKAYVGQVVVKALRKLRTHHPELRELLKEAG